MIPASGRRATQWMRSATAIFFVLILAGCASIPLGTLWKMRDLGPERLQSLDPLQLRVAGRIDPPPLRFRPGSMRLELTLTPSDGTQSAERHQFSLRETDVFQRALVPRGEARWQAYELDEAGIAAMRRVQRSLMQSATPYRAMAFSVQWDLDGDVPPGRQIVVSVRMQLATDEAPFTLIDRHALDVKP